MQILSDDELHRIVTRTVQQVLGSSKPSPIAPEQTKPVVTPAVPAASVASAAPAAEKKTVAIGTDHGGVDLKEILKNYLAELGYAVIDCGTNTKDAVDYPDIALAVARLVANGSTWRGVIIDGAGIGSCMSANKVPGIRAAMCYDYSTAVNSREHNDANVLTLGAGLIGVNLAKQILKTWLATEFGGGRHANRVEKIIGIEKLFMKEAKN
jgi:ribose 5-phosphate isomerase B